jgi:hypothetical protein
LLDHNRDAAKALQQVVEVAFDDRVKLRDATGTHDADAHGKMPRGC